MLVLSRKAGQKIHIGDDIVIEVRRVAGNRVTVALNAPRDIRILRGELQQAATEFEVAEEDDQPLEQPHLQMSRHTPAPSITSVTGHLAAGEMVG